MKTNEQTVHIETERELDNTDFMIQVIEEKLVSTMKRSVFMPNALSALSATLSVKEIQDLLASVEWYHKFEILPGVFTPGRSYFDAKGVCNSFHIPESLKGMKCLDIGAWDGPLTFELETRGAETYALDIQNPSNVGFNVARKIRQSRAVHYEGSVYQLPFDDLRDFDIIVFRGVYYHLKSPLVAFERIASSLKMGGILYFEGEGLINYIEDMDGNPVNIDLTTINNKKIPLSGNYRGRYKDALNWIIPNAATLESWITVCGMRVEWMNPWTDDATGQRFVGKAVKIDERVVQQEHNLIPPKLETTGPEHLLF